VKPGEPHLFVTLPQANPDLSAPDRDLGKFALSVRPVKTKPPKQR